MNLDAGQRRSLESFARQGTRRISRFRLNELIELGLVADHGDSHDLTDTGHEALRERPHP